MNDKFTLLVADDSETDLLLLRHAMSELGDVVDLQVTGHGGAVVSYLLGEGEFSDRQQHPLPDLIMLDLKMPVLTGLDVPALAARTQRVYAYSQNYYEWLGPEEGCGRLLCPRSRQLFGQAEHSE